jgi:hypothetical protein
MKKRILMSAALVLTLATLTGCNSSKTKTLTCTEKKSTDGFEKEEKWVYKFKDNRVSSATLTSTITAGGDYSQYIENYKTDAEKAADSYEKVNGVSAKVSQKSNKVTITVKFDTSKMEEADIDAYNLNESTESLPTVLEGYTCK